MKRRDDVRKISSLSCVLENGATSSVTGIDVENGKVMANPRYTTVKGLEINVCQQLQKKKATPEQEFRKAIIFIFLALFICYFPTLFCKFYEFAADDKIFILSATSAIGVLLNSSLNAIILIAFNKEMQRNIKSAF